jgi:RND family efflux transporter MFP subunit
MKLTAQIMSELAVVIGLSNLSGCGSASNASSRQESTQSEPVRVRLATVERTTAELPVRAVGRLEAKEEFQLSFKTGGIVARVMVDEGQRVTKGQLLAILRLTEIDAHLTQAQNGFDKAARDLERMKKLFEDSVVTLEQMQNATTAWEVAKAGLDAAAFNRGHAEIHAPSDGRILRRTAEDYEQIAPGFPILTMAGYEKGWIVRAGLADRDLLRLEVGDSAEVVFDALPGRLITGNVSEIGAAPNPINGTYEIEIRIDPSAERLLTGLIGIITISPSPKGQVSLVPIEALVEANGTSGFVFAPSPDNSTVHKVPVTVAYVHDGKAGIIGDLPGIDAVITAGATKLSDGAVVAVVK